MSYRGACLDVFFDDDVELPLSLVDPFTLADFTAMFAKLPRQLSWRNETLSLFLRIFRWILFERTKLVNHTAYSQEKLKKYSDIRKLINRSF